jgi:hypothetical protein
MGNCRLWVRGCRDAWLQARGAAEALGTRLQWAAASTHAGLRLRRRPGSSSTVRGMHVLSRAGPCGTGMGRSKC